MSHSYLHALFTFPKTCDTVYMASFTCALVHTVVVTYRTITIVSLKQWIAPAKVNICLLNKFLDIALYN